MSRGNKTSASATLSRRSLFLRSSAFDFVLVLAVSVCLVLTISYAFESAPDYRGNPLIIAAIDLPILLILYGGSYSKRAVVPAAVLVCIVVVVVSAASIFLSTADIFMDGQINDVAENLFIFALIALAVPVFVYLLSRRRWGVIVLFVAVVLSATFVQFLYRDWVSQDAGTPVSAVLYIATGALFIYQSYRESIYSVARLKETAFGRVGIFAVASSCLLVAFGACMFFALISNLGLQTPEMKPFQDYYVRPVVEYSGVYSETPVDSPDIVTSVLNEQQDTTNQPAPGGQRPEAPQDEEDQGNDLLSQLLSQLQSFDISSWIAQFRAISYQRLQAGGIYIVFAVLALIVAAVLAVKAYRRYRVRKLEKLPLRRRIWKMCDYLERRMARLGFSRPASYTPLEFAIASRSNMMAFAKGTQGVDYLQVTLIFQRACYDAGRTTVSDWEHLKQFYRVFFKNARKYIGRARWIWYFWRI